MQRLKDIVVGIDVGGPKKGFHAVPLFEGQLLERKSRRQSHVFTFHATELLLG